MVGTDNTGNVRQLDRPLHQHSALVTLLVNRLPQKLISPPSFVSLVPILSRTSSGFATGWHICFLYIVAVILFCIFG